MKLINKQEVTFIAIAVLLILAVAGFLVYSINFLFQNAKQALSENPANASASPAFNVEGLKKLGIME